MRLRRVAPFVSLFLCVKQFLSVPTHHQSGKFMRRKLFRMLIGAMALASLGACATDIATTDAAGDAKARDGVAYRLVASLTTEIGPRLGGSPAEAAAREWGARKLKELGFKNVRIETFTIPGWVRGIEHADIVSPTKHNLVVAALGGSISTPKGGITAPVAFVATYEDLLAAKEGAFTGRIVYVNDRMARTRDAAGYGPAVRKRSKGASEAAKRGAVAIVIRSVGTDSNRFAHAGNMSYAKDVVKKIPAAAISAPDADQIERLNAEGKTVTLHLDLQSRAVANAPCGNVIGEIPGTEKPEEIVLLGAHLDSWDLGTGAIDDGAGVGIVTAAALRAAPDFKPKRTIRVVLFGAEEVGVHGGDDYAKRYGADAKKHVLAMEADFGTGRAYGYSTAVPEADLPFYDEIGRDLASMGIERGDNKSGGGADISAMKKLGVPVASIRQDGTTYFDLHHTANDTLDKIEPENLEQTVEAFARVARAAANR